MLKRSLKNRSSRKTRSVSRKTRSVSRKTRAGSRKTRVGSRKPKRKVIKNKTRRSRK